MAVYSRTHMTLSYKSARMLSSMSTSRTVRARVISFAPVTRKACLRDASRSVTSPKVQRHRYTFAVANPTLSESLCLRIRRFSRVALPPVSAVSVAGSGAQPSPDTSCDDTHLFPWLLLPAAALIVLSKLIDGKGIRQRFNCHYIASDCTLCSSRAYSPAVCCAGILLACCWLACHVAPWPAALMLASAVTFKLNLLLSALLFAATPITALLAALPGTLPTLIPVRHLVNLTVRYPYFRGTVSIPRACAVWIHQHQGLCAYVNTMVGTCQNDVRSVFYCTSKCRLLCTGSFCEHACVK